MDEIHERLLMMEMQIAEQKDNISVSNIKFFFDVQIDCCDIILPAHKYVLSSRSQVLAEQLSSGVKELNWTNYEAAVGIALLRWIYTNEVVLNNDAIAVGLLRASYQFKLASLFETCEDALVSSVSEKTSLRIHDIGKAVGADRLVVKCLELTPNVSDNSPVKLETKIDDEVDTHFDGFDFEVGNDEELGNKIAALHADLLKYNKIANGLDAFENFSDVVVKTLLNDAWPAHTYFLSTRSKKFREEILQMNDEDNIHFHGLFGENAMNFLRWLYTDNVELFGDDDDDDDDSDEDIDGEVVEDTISMFKAAWYYELSTLFERCERAILNKVVVTSCVKFHNVATEVGSQAILNVCQQMITSYWNGLESQEFRQIDLDTAMDCDSSLCEMEVCELPSDDTGGLLILDDDCLLELFRYISLVDLGSIKATCTRLSELADQSFKLRKHKSFKIDTTSMFADIWKLKHFGKLFDSLSFEGLYTRYATHDEVFQMIAKYANEHLKSISFTLGTEDCVTDESFKCLEKILKNVETIKLKWFHSARHINLLLGYCKNLKYVHLEGEQMDLNAHWCSENVNVTTLKMFGLRSMQTLDEMCAKLPHLESLSCENVGDSTHRIIHLSQLNHLKRLKIDASEVNIGEVLQNFVNKNALKYLSLAEADINASFSQALGDFPNLTELELDNCGSFGENELNILTKTLAHIKKLAFINCEEITFDEITKIVEHNLHLVELTVCGCVKIDYIDKLNYLRLKKKRNLQILVDDQSFFLSLGSIGKELSKYVAIAALD